MLKRPPLPTPRGRSREQSILEGHARPRHIGAFDGAGRCSPRAGAIERRRCSPWAQSITAADVKRRIGIIANDSMGGRDTPSRGLDATARYIAAESAGSA